MKICDANWPHHGAVPGMFQRRCSPVFSVFCSLHHGVIDRKGKKELIEVDEVKQEIYSSTCWFWLSICSKGLANYNSLFYLWHQCYSRKPAHGLHIMNRRIITTGEKSFGASAGVCWEDCASIQPPPPNVPQRSAPHHPWSINTQSCSLPGSISLGLSI